MKLSVVASNRNRFCPNDNASQWFLKSIQWQVFKDFELVIADGGSSNYNQLQSYFNSFQGVIPVRLVQYLIGEPFERAKLNNVGIRQSKGEYIMTTDIDMLFAPKFISTLLTFLTPKTMVESRTMYWKSFIANEIYSHKIDPLTNLDACKIGRIKKQSTAGGCQCLHRDSWKLLRGFDEKYIGWGSEDFDLLTRAQMAGLNVKWMGESLEDIMLFHQPHAKTSEQLKKDLEHQEKNKKILYNIRKYSVNPESWGGMKD